ncbi:hypothetical protein ABPG74_002918 [Tetrahymena malaccensis]
MESINEVNRVQWKIVQPHSGPTEYNSQLSEIISYYGNVVSDKFTLSEMLSHSPDKQSKQQYLFKQGSLGLQQKSPKRLILRMITQEDDKISQQVTPNLRIKSQSNINDNICIKEDRQQQFQLVSDC